MAVSANIEPGTIGGRDARTVFRAFEPHEFLAWPAWERLERILGANGGSYGLSGPRGAGKSWLMMRAIYWAADRTSHAGIGLWYPSPSEYEPLAFLASLSDSFATQIEHWYRANRAVAARTARGRRAAAAVTATAIVVAVAIAIVVGLSILATIALAAGAALAAALLAFGAWLPLQRSRWPEYHLLREALLVREHARYTATRREATEVGGEGGHGVLARAKIARERELVERPATLSSLINDFRALAERAGRVSGRVVIAIDELDKMAEPDKARDLLRDIKGIFEVPRVHFLVSVSDEAARNLSLGALTERNEFNSSFYTVIQAQPATPAECADLLDRRRSVPRDVSLVLAVLAGGNPREVVRLAELAEKATTAHEAAMKTLEEEALTLRREVVTALDIKDVPQVGQDARQGTFLALADAAFEDVQAFRDLCARALDPELWEPAWRDAGWTARFEEPWRRLMVRLAVAGQLAGSSQIISDEQLTERLLDVVTATSQSSRVGRIVLERELRVDTRRAAPGAPSTDEVRVQLDGIARRYESIREEMPGGNERTTVMTSLVADAQRLAREAHLTADETLAKLASKAAGDRIVGLATVRETGDVRAFEPVLDLVEKPHTPFEHFQALSALESLRPALGVDERARVAALLDDPGWRARLGNDTPRIGLADRILGGLRSDPALA